MDKKWWAVIGLVLNAGVLFYLMFFAGFFLDGASPALELFLYGLTIICLFFSFLLFFKVSNFLRWFVVIYPVLFFIVSLFIISNIFARATQSVDHINGSVADKVNNLFNNP